MDPQRKEGIYVGCESPSIIKYLDPPTGNLLRGRFADCFFNEENFPCLVGQPMWEEAMRSELKSLKSRKVFSPVETTPKRVNPVGCKWVFVRKRDQFGNVSRYKARLVAQGFT